MADSHAKGRLQSYLSHLHAWQVTPATQTLGNHPSFTIQTAQWFGQKSFHPSPDQTLL